MVGVGVAGWHVRMDAEEGRRMRGVHVVCGWLGV